MSAQVNANANSSASALNQMVRQNTWFGTLPDGDGTAALVTGENGIQVLVDEKHGLVAFYQMHDGQRADTPLGHMEGDPHWYGPDGQKLADLPLDTPVEMHLPGGVTATIEMTAGPNGTAYVKSVFVQQGDNGWLANNVEPGGNKLTVQSTSTGASDLAKIADDNTPMVVNVSSNGQVTLASTGRAVTQDTVDGFNNAHHAFRTDAASEGESSSEAGGSGGSGEADTTALGDVMGDGMIASASRDMERNVGRHSKGGKSGKEANGDAAGGAGAADAGGGGTGIWGIIAAIAEKVDQQLAKTKAAIDSIDTNATQAVTAKQLAQAQIETAKLGWFGNTWQAVGQNATDAAKKPAEIH